MVARFQHGLVSLDAVLIALRADGHRIRARRDLDAPRRRPSSGSRINGGRRGRPRFRRRSANATASWDLSEARANSFPRPDEAVLARLGGPLEIEVHLAPEDRRRVDLEQRGLSKLRRVRPDVRVNYEAETTTGLFEQTNPHYGEVWYRLQDKRVVTRAVTAESVLESIYEAAGVTAPAAGEADIFRGHPLAAEPRGAALTFYGVWPVAITAAALLWRRRNG